MKRPETRRTARRGYAMLIVLVFLAVTTLLVAVNQRRITSVLRLEQARVRGSDFDEGPIQVMGRALELLETGLPPVDPHVSGITISTPGGPRSFQVTFESPGSDQWSVRVEPTDDPDSLNPLPVTFAD